ncbi:hypothetical protein GRJ2_002949400 [Grus japonensis]|uniref:Uncharacterized protein n=1 Tax=Grus japonensis TaxID=30415 RepID=A0ABC9Y4F3_GRUJA
MTFAEDFKKRGVKEEKQEYESTYRGPILRQGQLPQLIFGKNINDDNDDDNEEEEEEEENDDDDDDDDDDD